MYAKGLVASSLLCLSMVIASDSAAGDGGESNSQHATQAVSIIRLVAACATFEGQQVLTTGFAQFEFENFKICPSTELAKYDPTSCFWLRAGANGIPDEELRSLEDSSGTFVTIEARVGCSKYLYAGYLDEIELIVELETGQALWTMDQAMNAGVKQE